MGDPWTPAPRAWTRARGVGAVDEAKRLGSTVVGTEHLLLAALIDPTVRWAFRTVGVDLDQVRDEVVAVTGRRRPRTRGGGITTDAADAVMQAAADGDPLDEDRLDDAEIARVRQQLARRFLVRTRDSEARAVLDRLGVIRCRTRVLATIESNSRQAQLTPTPATPA